jgi:hypothetical protein
VILGEVSTKRLAVGGLCRFKDHLWLAVWDGALIGRMVSPVGLYIGSMAAVCMEAQTHLV